MNDAFVSTVIARFFATEDAAERDALDKLLRFYERRAAKLANAR